MTKGPDEMKLRPRVLICIAVTTVLLIASQHLLLSHLLLGQFVALEHQVVERNLRRVSQAVAQIGKDLHIKSVDWSEWDDTYRFMADRNQGYIKANMDASAVAKMQLDLILLLDGQKRAFYSLAVRRLRDVAPPNPAIVLRELTLPHAEIDLFRLREGFQGAIRYPKYPLFVSVRPILPTSGKGKARGWLVFAHYFDSGELRQLVDRTSLDIRSSEYDAVMPADAPILRSLSDSRPVIVHPLNDRQVAGYTFFKDIHGHPLLWFKVIEPRQIYRQGFRSVDYLTRLVAIAALAFSIVIGVLLEYWILRRLTSLNRQVQQVRRNGDSSARIRLRGRDEIGDLAYEVNGMLEALHEREERLRAYSENLEQLVEERTRQIEHQAYHDSLTGLPNRALFLNRLDQSLLQAKRTGKGIAVVFVDLDNFKVINDSQGHEAGDRLLVEVAARLQRCVRATDTVARLGGDEFTLLLEGLQEQKPVVQVVERITEELRAPLALPQGQAFVGASIGIALSAEGRDRSDVLLRDADTAMYHAKAGGKGGYAFFEQGMNDKVVERVEIEVGLRRALENGEIRVHYQPLLDLSTGDVCGVEALARWQHPERGLIPPSRFIPVAEETGLIASLGYWVLEEACSQMKAWHDRHPDAPVLTVNVNLSGRQLLQGDVVEQVQDVLQKTGLPAGQLKLEITESVFLADVEGVTAKLRALKELGVKLAIDDFGTGYSSISSLGAFPVDTVKIDRSFISRLGHQEGAALVAAIISLSKAMQLNVTGEGVETPEQVAMLQDLGCDTGQGYYFARPMPADALENQLGSLAAATPVVSSEELLEMLLAQALNEHGKKAA